MVEAVVLCRSVSARVLPDGVALRVGWLMCEVLRSFKQAEGSVYSYGSSGWHDVPHDTAVRCERPTGISVVGEGALGAEGNSSGTSQSGWLPLLQAAAALLAVRSAWK